MHDTVRKIAYSHGFSDVRFLSPAVLDQWHEAAEFHGTHENMPYDIPAAYPNAECVILLIKAYAPFEGGCKVPPFYIAYNAGYFAQKAVAEEIRALGAYCEDVFIPVRALCLNAGIGSQGKNGLLSIEPFGTRIALFTLVSNICEPLSYIPNTEESECPENCRACAEACPGNAIGEHGLYVEKCIRKHMGTALHPEFAADSQTTYIGCEICQQVCPRNSQVAPVRIDPETDDAFDMQKLIRGDTKAARKLVGKNITGGGKLTAEAINFAAREGLFEEDIKACLESPFEAVREAARRALNKMQKEP